MREFLVTKYDIWVGAISDAPVLSRCDRGARTNVALWISYLWQQNETRKYIIDFIKNYIF